eukprot:Seg2643.2 transcript_id=Seg2643.2/GoldUCD/mRNA.D3Y31 product=Fucolectin-1 protein_id=Seg2643.2/GoldUCD/D3Y31
MAKYIRATTLFVLLITITKSRILRLSCLHHAEFSEIKTDSILDGHVISTTDGISEQKCQANCMLHPKCKSINWKAGEKQICQLNKRSAADATDGVSTIHKAGWIFKSTSYKDPLIGNNCKRQNPCGFGKLCMDSCECPGYDCIPCHGLSRGLSCSALTVISSSKPTEQSSMYRQFRSSYGVDGDNTTCAHTLDSDHNSWWMVDFEKEVAVIQVAITNRLESDWHAGRLRDFNIRVGNQKEYATNPLCFEHAGNAHAGTTTLHKCTDLMRGRYLYIEQNLAKTLNFCEAVVYGYYLD